MTTKLSTSVLESRYSISFEIAQCSPFVDGKVVETDEYDCNGFLFTIAVKSNITDDGVNSIHVCFYARSVDSQPYAVKFGFKTWKKERVFPEKTVSSSIKTGICSAIFDASRFSIYAKDGRFYLFVEARLLDGERHQRTSQTGIDWNRQISSALEASSTSDFAIVVSVSKRIPCHKLILCLASPVFKAMFENQMQESVSNEIVISDFSEEVMISFLKCIYDQPAIRSELETQAEQLLLIANKYEVAVIADFASKFIIDRLCLDNVVDILLFGDKLGNKDIKLAAMNIMGKNSAYFWGDKDVNEKLGIPLMDEFYRHLTGDYSFDRCPKRQKT